MAGLLDASEDGSLQAAVGCTFLVEGRFAFRAAVYIDGPNGCPRKAWFSNELAIQVV
jgi:hypothetical protein